MNCIFCKIVASKETAYVVHQDEQIIVFLDISQASVGHLLVVPKVHCENIFDANEIILEKTINTCKKMANLCKEKLNCTGVNIIHSAGADAQQDVFHMHFHVIPRYSEGNLEIQLNKKTENTISLEEVFRQFQ